MHTRVLLEALSRGFDDRRALESMPHCRMFKQAYWSKIWNLAATERVKLYGVEKAAEGDVVLVYGREFVGVFACLVLECMCGGICWSHARC
jgi:tRNA(Glu) U13 pseudouridine synthase TruD